MKIVILSMQQINNFGSVLQAYSLKKRLEDLEHEVEFLPIEFKEEDNELLGSYVEIYDSEKHGNDLFRKISHVDKYFFNRLKMRNMLKKQASLFLEFQEEVLECNKVPGNNKYDYCVIGSDEVFNCNAKSPWGFTSQLFGNVSQAKNVITYAASCGTTRLENVPDEVKTRIKKTFINISAFSVRDNNTRYFTKMLSGKEPEINLDPVVIANFDSEMEKAGLPNKLPKKYCVIYSYYNRFADSEDITRIENFCRAHKFEIISVGAPQMWIKNYVICTPFEMLNIFKNAEFVITDTFHGTIFAAKYSRKFDVLIRESNRNKLQDLINRIGVEKHLIQSTEQLDFIYQINRDFMGIRQIEQLELDRTMKYLKESII